MKYLNKIVNSLPTAERHISLLYQEIDSPLLSFTFPFSYREWTNNRVSFSDSGVSVIRVRDIIYIIFSIRERKYVALLKVYFLSDKGNVSFCRLSILCERIVLCCLSKWAFTCIVDRVVNHLRFIEQSLPCC